MSCLKYYDFTRLSDLKSCSIYGVKTLRSSDLRRFRTAFLRELCWRDFIDSIESSSFEIRPCCMSCFYTIHVYSKQRNSDGSREAEEQEEHMLLDTGKVVRKNLFSTPRRLTVGP